MTWSDRLAMLRSNFRMASLGPVLGRENEGYEHVGGGGRYHGSWTATRKRWLLAAVLLVGFGISFFARDSISLARVKTILPLPPPIRPTRSGIEPSLVEHYNQVFSVSTDTGDYFPIHFSDSLQAANPSIIPHPTKPDTWIMNAQKVSQTLWFKQLACEAGFRDGNLTCLEPVLVLPLAATVSGSCEGAIAFFTWNNGPHDGRLFYGPDYPYLMYGSNSRHNCFGLWVQDFRMLYEWDFLPISDTGFRLPVDLQRPPPTQPIEKNWFLFWDIYNQPYLHYHVSPQRVFAALALDGSVGPDLAPAVREADARCMEAHIPAIPTFFLNAMDGEDIHQATNSLALIMCRRADPACVPSADNTFIFHIFQHKRYYRFHSTYDPHVMLFHAQAPFGLHAFSAKPIWITGRKLAGAPGTFKNQSEMLYVTSVNWKAPGVKYTGYLDDVLVVGFGIEDAASGGIDCTAESLLGELAFC